MRKSTPLPCCLGLLFFIANSNLLGLSVGLSVSPTEISAGTTLYDFIAHASEASWFSGAGALPFPGSASDSRGFAQYVDSALSIDDIISLALIL